MQRQLTVDEEKQIALEPISGWNKLGLVNDLTTDEMQVLCDLDLDDKKQHDETESKLIKKAIAAQRVLADDLAKKFEGCEDTSRDESLNIKYWNQAHPEPESKKTPKESKTAKFYTGHGKYSEIRLFFIRLYSVITALPTYSEKFLNLLKKVKIGPFTLADLVPIGFAITGLSFALKISVDIGVMLYTTFRAPRSEGEKRLTRWQRFKNVLHKGERMQRLEHDFNGLVTNLGTAVINFFLLLQPIMIISALGPLGPVMLLGGIRMYNGGLDIFRAIKKAYVDYKKYANLEAKIDKAMHAVDELRTKAIQNNNMEETKKQDEKYRELEFFKEKVAEKSRSRRWERAQPIIVNTLLIVGVILSLSSVFFPPLAFPGAILVGASLSFMAGSIFTGLGKRIAGSVGGWLKKKIYGDSEEKKPDNAPPSPEQDKNFTQGQAMMIKTLNHANPELQSMSQLLSTAPIPIARPRNTYTADRNIQFPFDEDLSPSKESSNVSAAPDINRKHAGSPLVTHSMLTTKERKIPQEQKAAPSVGIPPLSSRKSLQRGTA